MLLFRCLCVFCGHYCVILGLLYSKNFFSVPFRFLDFCASKGEGMFNSIVLGCDKRWYWNLLVLCLLTTTANILLVTGFKKNFAFSADLNVPYQ